MPVQGRSWPVLGWLTIVAALVTPAAFGDPATYVAAGSRHGCAVTYTGAVWCWGENSEGQLGDGTMTPRSTPVAVTGLGSGVVAVAAGYNHSCALTGAGAVWCWGRNSFGQLGDGTTIDRTAPVAASGLGSGVAAISAGFGYTCAVTTAGAALCWGLNSNGRLGDGTTTNRATPTTVSGLGSGTAAIDAGDSHACAATSAGAVLCWGENTFGQLGDGTTTDRSTPAAVSNLGSDVADVEAGGMHSCALTTGAAVWCWGANSDGQIGDGTTTTRTTPVAVSTLGSGVLAIAAGFYHTCAVISGSTASCWGSNYDGQIGDGTRTDRSVPTAVSGLGSGVLAIAAGNSHTAVVMTSGAIWSWGEDGSGELGDGSPIWRSAPVAVSGLGNGVARTSAGGYHSCAVTGAGTAWCWGQNAFGQLGDATATNRTTPVAVSGLGAGVLTVAAGGQHTCALTSVGAVWCWGSNWSGQLGDGTTTTRYSPVAVSGLSGDVVAITAGGDHTCAVTSGGALFCWGYNATGQLGDGTTTNRLTITAVSGLGSGVIAVAAGPYHTCAVTTGGAAYCWGSNDSGRLGDGTTTDRHTPTGVSGFTGGVAAIETGLLHTCALTTGGAVFCWGSNGWGQLGDGTTTSQLTPTAVSGAGSGAVRIAAGQNHSCVVMSGGAAACWGKNHVGQIGDGTTTTRLTGIAVSGLGSVTGGVSSMGDHTCGVTSGGAAVCWGSNSHGQLGDGRSMEQWTPVPTVFFRPWPSDVTRDGRSDVVWRHATGGDLWVWPMSGGAPVSQTHVGTVPDTGWQVKGLGDQTGDGRADLLWRHQTGGDLFLWTMNGTTVTAQQYLGAVVADYAIVGTADYTGDGKTDVLWRHQTSGALWLWRMNGATLEAVTLVATIDPAYAVVASGDVSGDGKADLLWRHQTNGDVWMWLMNGAAVTSQVNLGVVADLGYQVVGLADHDRDGRADLLWHHATSGDVWVWRMEGTTIAAFIPVATVGDTNFHVAGVGDYDGDGRADVLWHHATSGAVWVWLMNGGSITSATHVATVSDVGYQIVNPK